MIPSHDPNSSRPLAQKLLLAGLLLAGLAVMWHLSQNVIPREISLPGSSADAQQAEVPPQESAAVPPATMEPAGAAAEEAGDVPPAVSSPDSAAIPEEKSAVTAEPHDVPAAAGEGSDSLRNLESRTKLPRLVRKPGGRHIETAPILFNSGHSQIRETSYDALDRLATLLKDYPQIHLMISGHTDNLGSESVNVAVSAERAGAVKQYLASRGVDPSRLESKGMGSSSPIASNDTRLGRQENRRIEFLVTSPK